MLFSDNIRFDFDQVGNPADLSFNARKETEDSSAIEASPKEAKEESPKVPSPSDAEWSTTGPPTSTPMRRRTRPTLARRAKKN